ncbi:branched-chain amino acid ABC transporter permease [Vannielia litorea]|uniref:branched-chain amino acid ABC transporter permease n=1 Tax=Vannielia TaxID=2813041 RepID=UPI001C9672AE|nr:branched-chain amino acid ABC transporter permease [Vannielia litorea]MBY6046331.1 branched-chain amino acid ABC transporter permease [Vannielia litorea]MBY6073744.1 branched-chain amino acid ABC transporter permease [Vannielia litorea]MBY6153756.1 branched-chain amino acid ABC transporter permease [Vannielia litorea]
MGFAQILANGVVLGTLYACIAIGFSLVWGVLNVINMLHGSFIVLGGYLTYFAWASTGISPVIILPVVAVALFVLGYALQYLFINKVVTAPVLTTLTLTFGLDMILYNLMTVFFTATPRRVSLDYGRIDALGVSMPVDRLIGMGLALVLTGLLFLVLKTSRIGRAIVAVRMDREAAALMGIRVNHIYATTFAIAALMAGAAGAVFAMVFPVTTNLSGVFLGKAFVICVIGGLGGVSGALVGGLALGIIESFAGVIVGPQNAITIGFLIMLFLLIVRPTGLVGVKGYE